MTHKRKDLEESYVSSSGASLIASVALSTPFSLAMALQLDALQLVVKGDAEHFHLESSFLPRGRILGMPLRDLCDVGVCVCVHAHSGLVSWPLGLSVA